MGLVEPTNLGMVTADAGDPTQSVLNKIKENNSSKEQLKKVASEFESIFISQMFSTLDKTVDREGGIFGEDTKYYDTFKSYMYNEMGRQLASNPNTTFGFAKQIYEQMERFVKD